MHSRVVDVTQRLAERSAVSRAAYLEHIRNARASGSAPRWRERLAGFRRSVSAADQGAAVFDFLPAA